MAASSAARNRPSDYFSDLHTEAGLSKSKLRSTKALDIHKHVPSPYTGKATTNQTSRAPSRNIRAAERILIARILDRMSRNFGLALALPKSFFNRIRLLIQISASTPAMASKAPLKPINASKAPPRKKPAPLSAFFEPMRIAKRGVFYSRDVRCMEISEIMS